MPSRRSPQKLECLDVKSWRTATPREIADWYGVDRKPKKKPAGKALIVRSHLKPVDVYCYLKARFGEPNGFQNMLRRDDSDNWIHWDYSLKAGPEDVYIAGASREIHFIVSEALTDQQWKDLIVAIRTDFARVGARKSEILKGLEKFVVFQNKFVSLAGLCAELHAAILDAPDKAAMPKAKPRQKTKLKAVQKAMKSAASRANDLYGSCLKLRLLTPIMAEAYINMIIVMFSKDAVRDNPIAYDAFLRAKIPDRLRLLSDNCHGFGRAVDTTTQAYADFMRVIGQRNFALHGNVDPLREAIEVVYFDGKRPLFASPGNHIATFFDQLESIYRPEQVIADYESVHGFLWEVAQCMDPRTLSFFRQVISDAYPGFEVRRRRVTRILPDALMMSMLPGMQYDDELDVAW